MKFHIHWYLLALIVGTYVGVQSHRLALNDHEREIAAIETYLGIECAMIDESVVCKKQ